MKIEDLAPFLSTRLLNLILMPTEQCNFRCIYCYEDFALGEMPRSVIESVKALLKRRIGELEFLSLSWFGGEPLLAWPIVEEIQSFARKLASEHGLVRFSASMTTNASLLTPRRFARLLELGVRRFQIALDGSQEAHNLTRRRRGGGGSFALIWSRLRMMRASEKEFEAVLRLHVTRENQDSLSALLHDLASEFAGDSRFPVMFRAVRHWGGSNDTQVPIVPFEEEGALLQKFVKHAERLNLTQRQEVFEQPGMLQGCFASAVGSFVVRANGSLAKCTVFLKNDNNSVGVLNADGSVTLDVDKADGWLRGVLSGEQEVIRCPSVGWANRVGESECATKGLVQIGGGQRAIAR